MDRLQTTLLPLLGRVLLSILFIIAGVGKAFDPAGTTGYISAMNLPLPALGYVIALVVELGGGILLLTGLLTRWVALVLAVFCLFTAFVFHGFGDMANQINALKNIALAGGFLYVVAYGAGEWSLDALLRGRRGVAPLPA